MIATLGAWRRELEATAVVHPRHVGLIGVALALACADGGVVAGVGAALAVTAVVRATPLVSSYRRLALIGAMVLIAGVAGHARVVVLEHTALAPSFGQQVRGQATVLTAPRPDAFGGRQAVVRWHGERVLLRVPSWQRGTAPTIGEVVQLSGRIREPDRAARAQEAHATLRATDLQRTGRRRGGLLGLVDAIRRRAEGAFDRGLPPAEATLLRGMVLGQDEALPDDVREAFRTAGLSHLVAASGQNVMLLVALAVGLCMVAGVGFRARWLAVLLLIALYVPLAGAGAPIQRAAVAGVALVAARIAGRPSSRWYALLLGVVVTLALDPRSVAAVGWQLSFAAVVGIGALAAPLQVRLRRRLPSALAEAAAVTTAATLATAPLLATHFGRVSVVSLPANVLAAPAVPVVMWIGMVAAAIAQVAPGLSALVSGASALPLGYLIGLARAAAAVPAAATGAPVAAVTLVCAAAAWWVLAGDASHPGSLGRRSARRAVVAGCAAAGLLLALAAGVGRRGGLAPPAPGDLRVTALDIGQGDATLLQTAGHAVLVDAGPPGTPIVRELHGAGVRRLDAMVVTHPQADHDGGAPAVLDDVPVALLLDGRGGDRSATSRALDQPLVQHRVRVLPAVAGQTLRAGDLSLRVLWPPAGPAPAGEDPNDRAVVLEAVADGSRALLTADAESPVLGPLDLEPVDVLKVSHHGSADDGLPALLERLRPRVALIEVGRHNTYGHPAPATVRALQEAVPTIRRTDRDGTVRVDLRAGVVRAVAAG